MGDWDYTLGRSPYGERGLKSIVACCGMAWFSRSPYGERGLKYRFRGADGRKRRVALLTESVD